MVCCLFTIQFLSGKQWTRGCPRRCKGTMIFVNTLILLLMFLSSYWLEQFLPASCHNHFDSLKKWVSESKEHIIISHSTHMNNCNLWSGLCFTVAEPGFTSDSQSRCSYQSAPLGGSHWVFKHICRMVLLWE